MLHRASEVCSCEHGDEPQGSIKGREFLNYMSEYWLLNRGSAPFS
jgi:hypothetical protein